FNALAWVPLASAFFKSPVLKRLPRLWRFCSTIKAPTLRCPDSSKPSLMRLLKSNLGARMILGKKRECATAVTIGLAMLICACQGLQQGPGAPPLPQDPGVSAINH